MRIASVVFAFSSAAVAAADLPSCRVEALGPGLTGFAMNERGDVVGRRLSLTQIGTAFVVRAGGTAVVNLPLAPPWVSSDAYAISDTGVIVGREPTEAMLAVLTAPTMTPVSLIA